MKNSGPLIEFRRLTLDEQLDIKDRLGKQQLTEAPYEMATAGQIEG